MNAYLVARPRPPAPHPRAVVLAKPPPAWGRITLQGASSGVSGSVRPSIGFQFTAPGWLSGQAEQIAPPSPPSLTLSNGSGANQCRYAAFGTVSLPGVPGLLDLRAMADQSGAPFAFSAVRYLYVRNNATADGATLYVGGAGDGEWVGAWRRGSVIAVGPSTAGSGSAANNAGTFEKGDPSATAMPVATSSRLLLFDPAGQSLTFDILVVGA